MVTSQTHHTDQYRSHITLESFGLHVLVLTLTLRQLKEELEERGEAKSGNKAWLRRRLHAAIVRKHLEASDEL